MTNKEKTLVRYKGVEGEFIKLTLSFKEITDPEQLTKSRNLKNLILMDDGSVKQEQLSVGVNNKQLNLYFGDEPYFQRPISNQYCREHITETVAEQSKIWRENNLTVDEICMELEDLEAKLDGLVN